MNILTRTIRTSLKAGVLTSFIFALRLQTLTFKVKEFLFIFIVSLILTTVISLFYIGLTILPICYYNRKLLPSEIFYKYFPYYTLAFTVISLAFYFEFYFSGKLVLSFLIAVYVTMLQSWFWFFKPQYTDGKELGWGIRE